MATAQGFHALAQQVAAPGLSGAALRRMQELAQSLYDSTPGLQEGTYHFDF